MGLALLNAGGGEALITTDSVHSVAADIALTASGVWNLNDHTTVDGAMLTALNNTQIQFTGPYQIGNEITFLRDNVLNYARI